MVVGQFRLYRLLRGYKFTCFLAYSLAYKICLYFSRDKHDQRHYQTKT